MKTLSKENKGHRRLSPEAAGRGIDIIEMRILFFEEKPLVLASREKSTVHSSHPLLTTFI
jgi:hypothetical protein